jgi:hypothetical protein
MQFKRACALGGVLGALSLAVVPASAVPLFAFDSGVGGVTLSSATNVQIFDTSVTIPAGGYSITEAVTDVDSSGISKVSVVWSTNPSFTGTPANTFTLSSSTVAGSNLFTLGAGTYYVEVLFSLLSGSPPSLVTASASGVGPGGGLSGTPIPGALVLFGSVLAGAGLFMRRRRDLASRAAV